MTETAHWKLKLLTAKTITYLRWDPSQGVEDEGVAAMSEASLNSLASWFGDRDE